MKVSKFGCGCIATALTGLAAGHLVVKANKQCCKMKAAQQIEQKASQAVNNLYEKSNLRKDTLDLTNKFSNAFDIFYK